MRESHETNVDGQTPQTRLFVRARVRERRLPRRGKRNDSANNDKLNMMLSTIVTVNKVRVSATAKRTQARSRELFLSAERKARRGLRCV